MKIDKVIHDLAIAKTTVDYADWLNTASDGQKAISAEDKFVSLYTEACVALKRREYKITESHSYKPDEDYPQD